MHKKLLSGTDKWSVPIQCCTKDSESFPLTESGADSVEQMRVELEESGLRFHHRKVALEI